MPTIGDRVTARHDPDNPNCQQQCDTEVTGYVRDVSGDAITIQNGSSLFSIQIKRFGNWLLQIHPDTTDEMLKELHGKL